MNTKLLTSTLLAASLLGAPAVAFAQSDTASQPATSEAKPMAPHKMHHSMMHHIRKSTKSASATGTHFRAGTTTGLGSTSEGRARPGGQSVARKPAD